MRQAGGGQGVMAVGRAAPCASRPVLHAVWDHGAGERRARTRIGVKGVAHPLRHMPDMVHPHGPCPRQRRQRTREATVCARPVTIQIIDDLETESYDRRGRTCFARYLKHESKKDKEDVITHQQTAPSKHRFFIRFWFARTCTWRCVHRDWRPEKLPIYTLSESRKVQT